MYSYKLSPIIIFCLLASFIAGQSPVAEHSSEATLEEKLEYNVFLKTAIFYFHVGEVTLTSKMEKGRRRYMAEASTFEKWKRFYEFESTFITTLDSTKLYPQTFTRNSLEKGYTVFDSIEFNQEALTAEEFVSNNDEELFHYDLNLTGRVHNLISLFYSARYLEYSSMGKGGSEPIKLLHNRHEYDLEIKYHGPERKKIKQGGRYESHKLEINSIKGIHFDGDQMFTMWVTDDDERIPIAFETPMKFGRLKVVLKAGQD